MDLSSIQSMSDRDALIDLIKAQVDDQAGDEHFRRDIFLCLAVTIPPKQRSRAKKALESLLARVHSQKKSIEASFREEKTENAITHDQPQNGNGNNNNQTHSDDTENHTNDDPQNMPDDMERRLGIVSTLLVLGFSDVCDLTMGRQLMTLNRWSVKAHVWTEARLLKHKHLSLQLAFSMVLGLLDACKWPNMSVTDPEYQDLSKRVKADYRSMQFTASSQSFWLSWEGLHTRSLQLAGLLAYILRASGVKDLPRSDMLSLLHLPAQRAKGWAPKSLFAPSPPPPKLATAPKSPTRPPRTTVPLLENYSENDMRPQPDAWQIWYAERTRELVNSIEDGEWYGYYVYALGDKDSTSLTGQCDPAMENIHFKVGGSGTAGDSKTSTNSSGATAALSSAAASTPSTSKVPFEARGCRDGVLGEFDLEGTMHAGTGVVNMCKNYHEAHSWDYEGVITPLGIIGEWGREGTGFSGYFWLWKRSWMADDLPRENLVYYS